MSELTIHLPWLAQPAVVGERSSATDITPPPLGILMVTVVAPLVMALFASTYVPYRILTWSLAVTEGHINHDDGPTVLFMRSGMDRYRRGPRKHWHRPIVGRSGWPGQPCGDR